MSSPSFHLQGLSSISIFLIGFGALLFLHFGQSLLAEQVTLAWDANPEPDVVGYRLHYGTSTGEYPYSIDAGDEVTFTISDLSSDTTYYATVTAFNSSGLESLPSNEVTFETGTTTEPVNLPPVVSLNVSSSQGQIGNSAHLALNATAIDSDGTIDKIEFYNGTEKLGERTESPWFFFWPEVEAGTYTLTAIAFDNSGAEAQSSRINISVASNPHPGNEHLEHPPRSIQLLPIKAELGEGGADSMLVMAVGEVGQVATVYSSEDLLNWSPLGSFVISDGANFLIDPGVFVGTKRKFYRTTLDDG